MCFSFLPWSGKWLFRKAEVNNRRTSRSSSALHVPSKKKTSNKSPAITSEESTTPSDWHFLSQYWGEGIKFPQVWSIWLLWNTPKRLLFKIKSETEGTLSSLEPNIPKIKSFSVHSYHGKIHINSPIRSLIVLLTVFLKTYTEDWKKDIRLFWFCVKLLIALKSGKSTIHFLKPVLILNTT